MTAFLSILLAVGFSLFGLRTATAGAAPPPATSTTIVTAPADL